MERLQAISFKELVSNKETKENIMQMLISMTSSVTTATNDGLRISQSLESKCSDYINVRELKLIRALEYLAVAKGIFAEKQGGSISRNVKEVQALVEESAQLLKDSAKLLGNDRFEYVIDEMVSIGHENSAVYLCLQSGVGESDKIWQNQCYEKAIKIIEPHLEESKQLVSEILNGDNEEFKTKFCDYLLGKSKVSNRFEKYLIENNSLSVRRYLESGNMVDRKLLLWKYLVYNSEFREASKVLEELASDETSSMGLNNRIELLSIAANCIKSSNDSTLNGSLEELNAKKEAAIIQLEILNYCEINNLQEKVQQLNKRFLDINTLFNDFASPLNLIDQILMIYRFSNYYDAEQLIQIYSHLIFSENNSLKVTSKLCSLATELYPSRSSFPIDILIVLLGIYKFKHTSLPNQKSFICEVLLKCGIDLSTLVNNFNAIVMSFIDIINTSKPSSLMHTPRRNTTVKSLESSDLSGIINKCISDNIIGDKRTASILDSSVDIFSIIFDEYLHLLSEHFNSVVSAQPLVGDSCRGSIDVLMLVKSLSNTSSIKNVIRVDTKLLETLLTDFRTFI
ncbi:putative nucleoporin [Zancudomyces culisetae]|uniref:Putative nucleoporin n=1 Tax=Zancudomyces culisetae TaxID=1213189 RepID=A0A1R1PDK7_ZANCU|nr:putative nucleoporin [Zancudomyces culisetae]|eukprot:OMH79085.1 putative nucleoporin [Zancudomyces culisetae]